MTIRTRKFFGTVALLALVVVWSLMGMTVAQTYHQLDGAAGRLS
jgi:hypothetical protein